VRYWKDHPNNCNFISLFVQNKNFSNVLEKVKEVTVTHSCFISEKKASDETWFNYIFSLPEDRNKEILLAVQLFHLP
jgi:hypothetical protein